MVKRATERGLPQTHNCAGAVYCTTAGSWICSSRGLSLKVPAVAHHLFTRNPRPSRSAQAYARLQNTSAATTVESCDTSAVEACSTWGLEGSMSVSDKSPEAVTSCLKSVHGKQPLKGVLHAAGVRVSEPNAMWNAISSHSVGARRYSLVRSWMIT